MPTSFDCNFHVTANPQSGKVGIVIGPFEMGNLAELLDYLGSKEARTLLTEATARSLTNEENFVPEMTPAAPPQPPTHQLVVHLRGKTRTACGLGLWTRNSQGHPVATVASTGHDHVDQVTCEGCRNWWIEANR